MPDRYDQPDATLLAEIRARLTYAQANAARLGLSAATLTSVATTLTAADSAYAAHVQAQADAQGKRQAKDDALTTLESADRALVNQAQAASATTDADRQAMQLTVRDTTRTPTAAPATRPALSVDTSERLRHVIRFTDAVVITRGKPAGVFGCELWHKIGGAPPVDFKECLPLGTDTASPYLAEYEGSDAGKTVHYLGRWVSTRGEHGPWSAVVSATVTG